MAEFKMAPCLPRLNTTINNYHAPKLGRLNLEARAGKVGAWCVLTRDANQWLQIDLGGGTIVTKVVTQGRQDYDQWVTTYAISYSLVKSNWVYVMTHGKKKVYGCILNIINVELKILIACRKTKAK